MRDLALDRGLLLVENLNYRFMDVVVEALALLEQGAIGELVNLDVTFTVGLAGAARSVPRSRPTALRARPPRRGDAQLCESPGLLRGGLGR